MGVLDLRFPVVSAISFHISTHWTETRSVFWRSPCVDRPDPPVHPCQLVIIQHSCPPEPVHSKASKTEECSTTVDTILRPRPEKLRRMVLLASVAPLVKMTWKGSHPSKKASRDLGLGQLLAGSITRCVDTGGIPESLTQSIRHCSTNLRQWLSRGIVVEINFG